MNEKKRKVLIESIAAFAFFLAIGLVFWKMKGQIFFLFNFLYIGLAVASGELLFGLLPREKKVWGRRITQLLVGLYMLGVLGLLGRENMQIEGFFFYLLAGVFSGPVIHYLIAKIGGTFLFGRGWCGWACWTAMVLDFLPWAKPGQGRLRYWGALRYLHFLIISGVVLFLWNSGQMRLFYRDHGLALKWLIIGNLLYYAAALLMAAVLKDNRAFCKYLCPIPVLMKIGAPFSLGKIEIDPEKCVKCGLCERNCPMNIRHMRYLEESRRVLSTECILCQQCVNVCPQDAVRYSNRFDCGYREYLDFKEKG